MTPHPNPLPTAMRLPWGEGTEYCQGELMKIDLTGKSALVTGASRGIGESIARRLGEAGAHVVCAARSAERVTQLASEIGNATGVELDISAPDVRDRIGAILKERPIDILVNNAGRSEEHTSELQSQSNLVCRLLLEKKKTSASLYFDDVD